MGYLVRCHCGHEFHIHGYEKVKKCFECDAIINPMNHLVDATPDEAQGW